MIGNRNYLKKEEGAEQGRRSLRAFTKIIVPKRLATLFLVPLELPYSKLESSSSHPQEQRLEQVRAEERERESSLHQL
jgi:hypothetical protein